MKINQTSLEQAMQRKDLNIQQLSFRAQITYPTAHRLIKGEQTSIHFDVLERVCDALDITPNDLLERTEDDRNEVEAR